MQSGKKGRSCRDTSPQLLKLFCMELAPSNFELQSTSVWSFPDRGSWATHRGDYRGNFSPYIPRNLLLRYSKEGDTVLDPMCGSGTTLIECKLLNRNSLGIDINQSAICLARERLSFQNTNPSKHALKVGDARKTGLVDNSVDLEILHPPYLNIIRYNPKNKKDISNIRTLPAFLDELSKVAQESSRVLKPGKYCALLIGDTRRRGEYIPLSARALNCFLDAGFILKEDIIKQQWNCTSTSRWKNMTKNFLLIMHEHLFVFQK